MSEPITWKRARGEYVVPTHDGTVRVFRDIFRRWVVAVPWLVGLHYEDTMRDARAWAERKMRGAR